VLGTGGTRRRGSQRRHCGIDGCGTATKRRLRRQRGRRDAVDTAQAALASAVVSAVPGARIFLGPTMCHILVRFAACARGSLPAVDGRPRLDCCPLPKSGPCQPGWFNTRGNIMELGVLCTALQCDRVICSSLEQTGTPIGRVHTRSPILHSRAVLPNIPHCNFPNSVPNRPQRVGLLRTPGASSRASLRASPGRYSGVVRP